MKVKKGVKEDTTTSENATITHTVFTGETDTQAVARAKSLIADGSVNVDFGADQTAKTSAVQTYVNGLLGDIGVRATVAFKEATDVYTVTITKGSVTDTKDITMTVNIAADPDIASVNTAKDKADKASYPNPTNSSDYVDEKALANYVQGIASTAINDSTVTVTVNKASYTVATDGTKANPNGTDGSYKFTITVSKGTQFETTTEKTIIIPATKFGTIPEIDGNDQTQTGTPQTGDTSNVMLYLFVALISLGGLGFVACRKKVRNI